MANEVRNLARRSAEAAKEIASLIGNSVASVETGGKLVDDAGGTITDIVAAVERVTAFMRDISAASQEQSVGIGQVNEAVAQMEAFTVQNARLAEQAESESRQMRSQALKLAQLVGSFRLPILHSWQLVQAGLFVTNHPPCRAITARLHGQR